jgi:hypothetical protein
VSNSEMARRCASFGVHWEYSREGPRSSPSPPPRSDWTFSVFEGSYRPPETYLDLSRAFFSPEESALSFGSATTHVGTAAPGCPAAQVYRAAAGSSVSSAFGIGSGRVRLQFVSLP